MSGMSERAMIYSGLTAVWKGMAEERETQHVKRTRRRFGAMLGWRLGTKGPKLKVEKAVLTGACPDLLHDA